MRFSYRLVRDKSGFVAECVESEAQGEGKTAPLAVASLRKAIEERMFRPDAIAPPSRPAEGTIELELADGGDSSSESRERDLDGPGDVAPR